MRTLYRWKDIDLGREKKVREPKPRGQKLEEEIRQLKQSLANRTLEADLFKALQRIKARRQRNTATGGEAFTTKSEE